MRMFPAGRSARRRKRVRRKLPRSFETLEDRCLLSVEALAEQSAQQGLAYLQQVMDQYHNRYIVYEDVSSPGNHFHTYTKLPNEDALVSMNTSWTAHRRSGATAIRATFQPRSPTDFGGFFFLVGVLPTGQSSPEPNFGTVPDAGIDLSGSLSLTFWARGENGGEKIEFFVGGAGRDARSGVPTESYPDSSPRHPGVGTITTLTSQWRQYTINLRGLDLSYVLNGFGWVASPLNNPDGAVFYLDHIIYELSPAKRAERLSEPRLVRSYTTGPYQSRPEPVGDFDLRFRNVAFAYDNALASLAFLADGSPDSMRRAFLLGDALVYVIQNDPVFSDGRVRSVYAAGDIKLPPGWRPAGKEGTIPAPGFWDEAAGRFINLWEVGDALSAIDVGNQAWSMIALIALHRATGQRSSLYLDTARRIGEFIRGFRNDQGTYRGFLGGLDYNAVTGEYTPRRWASTEHNLDVYAAFRTLGDVTGERRWFDDAQHARRFVLAMWNEDRGYFHTGTKNPNLINTIDSQIPLDAQAWSVLALPDLRGHHTRALEFAVGNHRRRHQGFLGFDFNTDRDGVWFEGTAQMAVAYAFAGRRAQAERLKQELRRAQQTGPFGNGRALAAASRNGLTTGFDFDYHRRYHIGATAWHVFAQLGYDPFSQRFARQATIGDYTRDYHTNPAVYRPPTSEWFIRDVGARPFGAPGFDLPVPADYSGNNRVQRAVYRVTTAQWLIEEKGTIPFGAPGRDWPVPADYSGNGHVDLAVYRPDTAEWFLRGIGAFQFGAARRDLPVPGDYTGDGKANLAVYRPDTAEWFLQGVGVVQFGAAGLDIPVPGDYTGNGRIDLAVFRPTSAEWLIRGVGVIQFGAPGVDLPVPGDYDGDRKLDIAVYRPRTAEWFVRYSGGGSERFQFGAPNLDLPLNLPWAYRFWGQVPFSPRGVTSPDTATAAVGFPRSIRDFESGTFGRRETMPPVVALPPISRDRVGLRDLSDSSSRSIRRGVFAHDLVLASLIQDREDTGP